MGLKKIAFLVPKPGMSGDDFRDYWRETHGPLVAGSPGYGEWRLRYAQNHVLDRGPVGAPFAFSGMAMFWLPGPSPNEDTYAQTSIYRGRIKVDEMNFVDMDRTVSMSAHEHVLKAGNGEVKVVVLSARATGVSADGFSRAYRQDFAPVALASPVGSRVAGWSANITIPGTFRLPGARPVDGFAIDCVEELWFASRRDAQDFFADPLVGGDAAMFGPRQSFIAEEIVFFDAARGGPIRG